MRRNECSIQMWSHHVKLCVTPYLTKPNCGSDLAALAGFTRTACSSARLGLLPSTFSGAPACRHTGVPARRLLNGG